ncbi:MAG: TolC family protein, partial [Gammaproteobacteria bacterium]
MYQICTPAQHAGLPALLCVAAFSLSLAAEENPFTGPKPLDTRPYLGIAKTRDAETEEAFLMDEALNLEQVLAYAQERNPVIKAGESRLLAAQKAPTQASAYEDPMLSWESWNAPDNFRLNEANNNIFRLSQKIPFPGKLRLKGEIASKEAERMEAGLRATEIDTVAQLKQAYYDLWLVYR